MSNIPVNDLRKGEVFKENGQPFVVVKYSHVKMGRGNAVIKIKAKNLKTGAVLEKSFLSGSSVEEADVEKIKVQYLYKSGETYSFMDSQTFETIELSRSFIGDDVNYLKEGEPCQLLKFEGGPVSLELPLSVVLKIAETGSGFKGNSVTNMMKPAKLETGLEVQVPNFINEGESVKIDTRTGEYVERA
ncbi:MAG: elongation factor P [Patescibacteria group bacterium]|nr:elongation factor P [Patescibacteria group bacterium]